MFSWLFPPAWRFAKESGDGGIEPTFRAGVFSVPIVAVSCGFMRFWRIVFFPGFFPVGVLRQCAGMASIVT